MSAVIRKPYLLMVGDTVDPSWAKTALGLRDWSKGDCLGQWRFSDCAVDLGLPDMTPEQAAAAGARTLVIGITVPGGRLPDHWQAAIARAALAGLDLASGMHQRLGEIPAVVQAAQTADVNIHDVRHSNRSFPVGTGVKRSGKRLLTVGTDCALGKKYTALAIAAAMRARGMDATFRATGQTGILIAGDGVPVDATVADFISGAAEALSPGAAPNHWDVIEGQGSLFHPSYAGVTLGLMHGSQPDVMVLCHHPERTAIRGLPHQRMPALEEAIRLYEMTARVTNPAARTIAIALNTSGLDDETALDLIRATSDAHSMPCVDPIRTGVEPIIEALIEAPEAVVP